MAVRDTLILDVEVNPASVLAQVENARAMYAGSFSQFSQTPALPFIQGVGPALGGYPNVYGNPAAAAAGYPTSFGGQLFGAAFPGIAAPPSVPPQVFGQTLQNLLPERLGYGLADLALEAGKGIAGVGGALAGAAVGADFGGTLGSSFGPIGSAVGTLAGGYAGSLLGGAAGGALSFPIGLVQERLGNIRGLSNTFRSFGNMAGFGPGYAEEEQGTIRGLSRSIAEMSGDPNSEAYDIGAISRGEDPAGRAQRSIERGLQQGAFGQNNSYQRPQEFLGKAAQFLGLQNLTERELYATPSEATDLIAGAYRSGNLGDYDKTRRQAAVIAGGVDAGVFSGPAKGNFRNLEAAGDAARQEGIPGGVGRDVFLENLVSAGSARKTGAVPEEQVLAAGGTAGLASQLTKSTLSSVSEGNPLGAGSLLLRAVMKPDGTVDQDRVRELSGAPLEVLYQEAIKNQQASGMGPTEFEGLLQVNRPELISQIQEGSPGALKSTGRGAIVELAAKIQGVSGKPVGENGPDRSFLQLAARRLNPGSSSQEVRNIVNSINSGNEGDAGQLERRAGAREAEAQDAFGGLGETLGLTLEETRKQGTDAIGPAQVIGEAIGRALLIAIASSPLVGQLQGGLGGLLEFLRREAARKADPLSRTTSEPAPITASGVTGR